MNSAYNVTPAEIRSLRKSLGMTQRELADMLGVKDPRSIGRYERGVQKPSTLFGAALLLVTLVVAYRALHPTTTKADLLRVINKRERQASPVTWKGVLQ